MTELIKLYPGSPTTPPSKKSLASEERRKISWTRQLDDKRFGPILDCPQHAISHQCCPRQELLTGRANPCKPAIYPL